MQIKMKMLAVHLALLYSCQEVNGSLHQMTNDPLAPPATPAVVNETLPLTTPAQQIINPSQNVRDIVNKLNGSNCPQCGGKCKNCQKGDHDSSSEDEEKKQCKPKKKKCNKKDSDDSHSDSDSEDEKSHKKCKPKVCKVPEIKRVFDRYKYVTAFPPAFDFPTEYKCYRVEDFAGKHGKLELKKEKCPIEVRGDDPAIQVTQQCRALSQEVWDGCKGRSKHPISKNINYYLKWETKGDCHDPPKQCFYACVNPICPPSPPYTLFDADKHDDWKEEDW